MDSILGAPPSVAGPILVSTSGSFLVSAEDLRITSSSRKSASPRFTPTSTSRLKVGPKVGRAPARDLHHRGLPQAF